MGLTERAVIIAAGKGERLGKLTSSLPKCLVPVYGRPMIDQTLDVLTIVGIKECVIVTGFEAPKLRSALTDRDLGLSVTFVHNQAWEKKNGVSVLSAEEACGGKPFLLMMSDHLVSVPLLRHILSAKINEDQVALGVDARVEAIFDPDDATKVVSSEGYVTRIGKSLEEYNGIDCGVFHCTESIFVALKEAFHGSNDCSLTDGCVGLAEQRRLRSAPIQDSSWLDVDTPEALAEAERLGRFHFLSP